ncbi:hypothetical protein [Microbacterium sp. P5_E9]
MTYRQTDYWTVKQNGDNSMYANPDGLPFAPEDIEDAEWGVVYLAGINAGEGTCPFCPAYRSVKSKVQLARYFGRRWAHTRCVERQSK